MTDRPLRNQPPGDRYAIVRIGRHRPWAVIWRSRLLGVAAARYFTTRHDAIRGATRQTRRRLGAQRDYALVGSKEAQ